jgi:hypothetical protein
VGVRSDLTISVADKLSSSAHFQFPSMISLFQCFNLLRAISEATRREEVVFHKTIADITARPGYDETPFSSIEVELPECAGPRDLADSSVDDVGAPAPVSRDARRSLDVLQPVRYVFDYSNHLRFDVHIKLRTLFVVSSISFALKFIPFLPLFALLFSIGLLYRAWLNMDEPPERTSENPRIKKIVQFFGDWFEWRDPQKTLLLLKISTAIFVSWALLPPNMYLMACLIGFAVGIVRPVYRGDYWKGLISGFWFCT